MNDSLNDYFKNEYRMSYEDFWRIEIGLKKILNTNDVNKKQVFKSKTKRLTRALSQLKRN